MIRLYAASWCPFCQKVIAFCHQNNIPFEERDIDNPTLRAEFKSFALEQVISYMIDSDTKKQLYDSGEIIKYLRDKFLAQK